MGTPRWTDRVGGSYRSKEVRVELTEGDDALVPWARGLAGFFVDPDDDQGNVVADIHSRFPKFIELMKPHDADPWCIALAVVRARSASGAPWIVVNQERVTHPHKMPAVCREFSMTSMRLLDFFDALGGF